MCLLYVGTGLHGLHVLSDIKLISRSKIGDDIASVCSEGNKWHISSVPFWHPCAGPSGHLLGWAFTFPGHPGQVPNNSGQPLCTRASGIVQKSQSYACLACLACSFPWKPQERLLPTVFPFPRPPDGPRGVTCRRSLGICESNNLSSQWQSYPDLLALPYLHNSDTCIKTNAQVTSSRKHHLIVTGA